MKNLKNRSTIMNFRQKDWVIHQKFGKGIVQIDNGDTVLVRFGNDFQEVEKFNLKILKTPLQALRDDYLNPKIDLLINLQARIINSINDTWGIFTISKIELLPHQLWVCRKVIENWPTKWLVADDVGLGKTIEAGLILWPLIAKGLIRRLLIIVPASLVDMWQYRLRTLFDIRLSIHTNEADSERSGFWDNNPFIVVSLQKLRMENDRQERLLSSEEWDMVIVDEAHHLNADEDTGLTLGYKLIKKLLDNKKISSMLFFTGTPHRGKDFGFFALLKLLKPDTFDPRKDTRSQLPELHNVLIRNNKQSVTDLKGNKIFKVPRVYSKTYNYTDKEKDFYKQLTDFIQTGKAYASTLTCDRRNTVILVLITMQKLASSSINAVKRALCKRIEKLQMNQNDLDSLNNKLEELKRDYNENSHYNEIPINDIEEQIASLSANIKLMEDEIDKTKELISKANEIKTETRIKKIIQVLKDDFKDRNVLLFTEYKATQSLLISELMHSFGKDSVTFINGDSKAIGVYMPDGNIKDLYEQRIAAADKFNKGEVRFLVSTEAAGEGIDLQEKCHSIIHVDLPWNPMRLHQRVGRINRYGQKEQVEVISFRNPETVESRVWEKIDEKLERINRSIGSAMSDPEDFKELILGMTSQREWTEIFSESVDIGKDSFDRWFDSKTARFGNDNAIMAVKNLLGNCEKFDFSAIKGLLPDLDLIHLKPFFKAILSYNNKKYKESENGISFKTPEMWLEDFAVNSHYKDMRFDRKTNKGDSLGHILGIGSRVFNMAIKQAIEIKATISSFSDFKEILYVFKIYDRLTENKRNIRNKIAGIAFSNIKESIYTDNDLMLILNELYKKSNKNTIKDAIENIHKYKADHLEQLSKKAQEILGENLLKMDIPFKKPEIELIAIILPDKIEVKL